MVKPTLWWKPSGLCHLDAPRGVRSGYGASIRATNVEAHQSAAARVTGTSVRMDQGAIGLVHANEVHLEQGAIGAVAADEVEFHGGFAYLVLARRVSGQVTVLLDWRAAAA